MAAHEHAVAQHSMYQHFLYSLLVVYYLLSATHAQTYVKYSRHELIGSNIRLIPEGCIFNQEDPRHDIPLDLVRPPGSPWITLPARKQATEVAQREEAEARLQSWDTSYAMQRNAQASAAEPLCHKRKITYQQNQGAGTYYIHSENHPGLLCYGNYRDLAQPSYSSGGYSANRAYSTLGQQDGRLR